ncbi:non-hydrolyzing UDP-N-acetylglucosamine 2-epimerase [Candidatus Zixiibacteriota bacterium]
MNNRKNIVLVAAARPNFMKIAPVYTALRKYPEIFAPRIIHTGQHYDYMMSKVFFEELSLPEPHAHLDVGSSTHGKQTARALERCENYLQEHPTDLVIVVGDVNSTAAAALAAAKLQIPVAHVEAGLRSGDRRMPEELNRLVTDCLADILYTHSVEADENLRAEGIPEEKIVFVGNVMIDTLLSFLPRAAESTLLDRLGLIPGEYAVLTMHRPENVDSSHQIELVAEIIEQVSAIMPLVFPIHPRSAKNLSALLPRSGWDNLVVNTNLRLIDPLGYADFLRLEKEARVVLTDSGGVQEETTALGTPCLTLRDNTERPVTVTCGTNTIVGLHPDRVTEAVRHLAKPSITTNRPAKWDGQAAERIVEHLLHYFNCRVAVDRPTTGKREVMEVAG